MSAYEELRKYPVVMPAAAVAEVLGLSVKTVRRQCAAGTFPIQRLRNTSTLKFRKTRVIQFLEDETIGGAR